MKEIVIAITASLGTAIVFWAVANVGRIPNMISVPPKAVIAFDSAKCPTEGWEEFKAAHGRFIRGIDRSGSKVDPDGEREPSSFQDDMLKSHKHTYVPARDYSSGAGDHARAKPDGRQRETSPTGGAETRPKNVALLYCVKL